MANWFHDSLIDRDACECPLATKLVNSKHGWFCMDRIGSLRVAQVRITTSVQKRKHMRVFFVWWFLVFVWYRLVVKAANDKHQRFYKLGVASLTLRVLFSMISNNCALIFKLKALSISRMQVGLVILISVR